MADTEKRKNVRYILKNGRIIDPVNGLYVKSDILISGGKIEKIGKDLEEKCDRLINAEGKIIAPGLVDMHTHLREPGREDKETIASGTRSAVRGGFTTVACMPNTEPAIDSPRMVNTVKAIIKKDAACNVVVVAAMTMKREGRKVSGLAALRKAGAAAVSDDGSSIKDAQVMKAVLRSAKQNNMLAISHCEDAGLSAGGMINSGFIATKMGLRPIPGRSEYEIVKRDIDLAHKTGAAIHIAHVSCKESVEIIRRAKRSRVKVTAETAPHYFSLTDECCAAYDTNTKMNPPLRSKEDIDEIKKGLSDGTIDAIATDHAPHTDAEKDVEFDLAPFGIIGLETALSISIMELIEKNVLSWRQLIEKMSTNPARILGLDIPGIQESARADIVLIDPAAEYIYREEDIVSKSRNSPFLGWTLKGRATHVFVGGVLAMETGL